MGAQHRPHGSDALVDHLPQPVGEGAQREVRLTGKQAEFGWCQPGCPATWASTINIPYRRFMACSRRLGRPLSLEHFSDPGDDPVTVWEHMIFEDGAVGYRYL